MIADDGINLIDARIVIMSYGPLSNGTKCRQDRLYNATTRMRTPGHEDKIPNYNNCQYRVHQRPWWKKGRDLGVGHAEWTEPYDFSEGHRGMSYVVPSRWN